MCKRTGILLIAALIGMFCLGLSEFYLGSNLIFTSAEARIGRPLTPVSVAGVARRTVRRCAVGVYYC
jgi:hypothetical protein